MKKIKLRQVVFELVANLNRTSSRNSFAKFYDLAIKFLRNSKFSTKLSNDNVINFYITFVRASFTHIFLKNKERENAYKRQEQICDKNEKDRTS